MREESTGQQERRALDWPLVAITAILAGLGLLMILSASSLEADARYGNALHFVTRQIVGLVGGVALGAAALAAPWSWIRKSVWPIYFATLVSLVLVMTPLGHSANGATRWISLGPINVQPSEFAKVALVLILSHYLACNEGRLRDVVGVVLPGLTPLLPLLLFAYFQKDFGTTVILFGLTGVLFFVAGLQWRYVVGGITGSVLALAGLIVVEPYRIQRLINFLDPFEDMEGAGYQVVQGWIALATGGFTGTGLASGVAQRGFVPEAHTDFIIAVIGEELGALGWTFTMLLLIGLVWRGVVIASRASSLFGMLVASGLSTLFAAQAIINVGVVGGVLPPKGLVLPFLSYGASAAVVHTACVGLLLRISMEGATVPVTEQEGARRASTEAATTVAVTRGTTA